MPIDYSSVTSILIDFTGTVQLQLSVACRRLLLFGPRPVHRASGCHCTAPLPGALARCSLAMALSAANAVFLTYTYYV